jgi:hypothetical protein
MQMSKLKSIGIVGVVGVLVAVLAATGSRSGTASATTSTLPQGSEPVDLNPADFTTQIDNPYWPMVPGSHWVYREKQGGERLRVDLKVTNKTRLIANGIEARVVHDVVTSKGEPVEVTDDWYAQDSAGNIWYLGEDTAEYKNGKVVSHQGAWEAGVDGAQPGIAMPANPEDGMTYRQEYYAGEAEDRAEVLSLDEQVQVPYGHFPQGQVLMTKDLVPLEPKVLEHKFYVKGVGPVLTLDISGAAGREELLRYHQGE